MVLKQPVFAKTGFLLHDAAVISFINLPKIQIMIQRIQTLWLLLAAIFSFLTFKLPFYSGNRLKEGVKQPENVTLDSTSQIFLMVLAAVVIILCFAAMVMYKKRKQQLNITIANVIFSVILVVLYFLQIQKFV